ncbi:hypothetical protein MMC18_007851 [Xylographa bjoerkii]|nr:hypothetical protein [Xylographa bjoerkii]
MTRCRKSGYVVLISGIVIDVDRSELSKDTLALLQDFYNDQDTQQKRFEELKLATECNAQPKLSMDLFTEDWNASQFWYNDETALVLAKEILYEATTNTSIAVVSAPSAFIQIKNLLVRSSSVPESEWRALYTKSIPQYIQRHSSLSMPRDGSVTNFAAMRIMSVTLGPGGDFMSLLFSSLAVQGFLPPAHIYR